MPRRAWGAAGRRTSRTRVTTGADHGDDRHCADAICIRCCHIHTPGKGVGASSPADGTGNWRRERQEVTGRGQKA